MSDTIDYFFAPNSPWTFLGHQRLTDLAQAHGATVRVMPVDLGQVFSVSGGLPLPKRAPQRQAYRLAELRRFAQYLKVPLNPEPTHFPVAGDPAAKLILATDAQEGWVQAMRLTGAIGDGAGKWRFLVTGEFAGMRVQSLNRNNTDGTVTNLTDYDTNDEQNKTPFLGTLSTYEGSDPN